MAAISGPAAMLSAVELQTEVERLVQRARVLVDAAHQGGMFAGGFWPNPLDEGAHLMTFSTYKRLGGPPGGLVLTNEADLAERLKAIAYPGLTANFDAGKTAALGATGGISVR